MSLVIKRRYASLTHRDPLGTWDVVVIPHYPGFCAGGNWVNHIAVVCGLGPGGSADGVERRCKPQAHQAANHASRDRNLTRARDACLMLDIIPKSYCKSMFSQGFAVDTIIDHPSCRQTRGIIQARQAVIKTGLLIFGICLLKRARCMGWWNSSAVLRFVLHWRRTSRGVAVSLTILKNGLKLVKRWKMPGSRVGFEVGKMEARDVPSSSRTYSAMG